MATYSYECSSCLHQWDVWGMSLSRMPVVNKCAKCSSPLVHRVLTPLDIHGVTEKEIRVPSKPTKVYIKR